jgi:predicted glycosyltransferase
MELQNLRILVAPLHWGLGHATRCIPIIEALLQLGATVVLASDGAALALLRAEFPNCEAIELPSYRISYRSSNMIWNMAWQLPRILWAMRLERLKLANIIDTYKINALISDNRYGFFSKKIPSIFISHQLHLRIPNRFLQKMARWLNYRLISRYTACWLPDFSSLTDNLSGDLAHPVAPLKNVEYIGALSRLKTTEISHKTDILANLGLPHAEFVLLLLSGPEPQRTNFETLLLAQIKDMKVMGKMFFLLVRGKIDDAIAQEKKAKTAENSPENNIFIFDYLGAGALSDLLPLAEVVVARSGYSTLMDFAALGLQHILFVPTPGQTEQEYLGQRLADKNRVACQRQKDLDLWAGIAKARDCKSGFVAGEGGNSRLKEVLRAFLGNMKYEI